MPGVTVMPGVVIDKCSIVNTSATIDHDVVVSEGCHIMGSSYIAGRVKIGRYSTIGSNATIFPDITIGENCFIGAGSVVNRNVEDNKVVVGNPAAYLRENRDLSSIFIL
jgi:acetyltransferase-like isoleucine patch superfamily enzyme